jgi:hypothetical protein
MANVLLVQFTCLLTVVSRSSQDLLSVVLTHFSTLGRKEAGLPKNARRGIAVHSEKRS